MEDAEHHQLPYDDDRSNLQQDLQNASHSAATPSLRSSLSHPEEILSASEKLEATTVETSPDGGLQGWLQVLGSWIVMVETWGLVNSFGVFQTYYETDLLTAETSSSISWIGSVQGALLFFVGVLSGPLFDAGYFKQLLIAGLFLIVLGQFMTSLCSAYWQVMLAQGICIGLGMGLTFLPSTAIISQYFTRRRALALGIASSGSPVAGIVFPVLFSRLQPAIGFAWATRIIAFILLALSVIPIAFMRTRTLPTQKKNFALFNKCTWSDMPFLSFVVASFLAFLVLYVPFFYIELFAIQQSIWSLEDAEYLIILLNVGSIFGRIVPNAIADRAGPIITLIVCTFSAAILSFGWLGMHNLGSLVVFALLYGAFSGGVVALTPAAIITLTPNLSKVGARMGTTFMLAGLSLLVGPPIAGTILGGSTEVEWLGTISYTAGGLILATFFYCLTRVLPSRKR